MPNNGTDDQTYRLEDQVGFIMRRATQRHLAIFTQHIPDLTPPQLATLAKLHESGPVSQNHLGRLTAMDAATMKGIVDRLAKRDLVSTGPHKDDLRRVVVTLTDEGRQTYLGHVEAARTITTETLACLSDAEQAEFLKLLTKMAGAED